MSHNKIPKSIKRTIKKLTVFLSEDNEEEGDASISSIDIFRNPSETLSQSWDAKHRSIIHTCKDIRLTFTHCVSIDRYSHFLNGKSDRELIELASKIRKPPKTFKCQRRVQNPSK